jgi:hypothetical protein
MFVILIPMPHTKYQACSWFIAVRLPFSFLAKILHDLSLSIGSSTITLPHEVTVFSAIYRHLRQLLVIVSILFRRWLPMFDLRYFGAPTHREGCMTSCSVIGSVIPGGKVLYQGLTECFRLPTRVRSLCVCSSRPAGLLRCVPPI